MPSPFRLAARPLLVLATAGLAATLPAAPLRAQTTDPFALPKDATIDAARSADTGVLLSEIVVDGRARPRMVSIEGRGDDVTIDADDARAAGLPVPHGASGALRITALKLHTWKFDSFRQRLTVTLLRKNDGPNLRDLGGIGDEGAAGRPVTALRIDYDMTSEASSRGVSFGGLFEAALVRGGLAVAADARVLASTQGRIEVRRLDTQAQFRWDSKGIVATAGDFISAGSQSQRPVRMGGLQIGTDAGSRPDLVAMPLPEFTGTVAVPTTVDLVSAESRREVGMLEPGAFTVRNIPVPMGRGEITAVLRDSLGRETLQTARFYVSRDLLARNRSSFAVNAGFVRRRFGIANADYGPLAASAYYRRGLSSDVTVEGSAEWTAGTVNVGARVDFVVAKLAKATLEGRISRDSVAGSGHLINVGLESIGSAYGAIIGATMPSATYRDVATRLGDPAPPRRIFANAFWQPSRQFRLQAGFVRSDERADPRFARPARRIDSAVASAQYSLSKRTRFVASTTHRWSSGLSEQTVSLGVSIALGNNRRVAAQGLYGTVRSSAELQYAREENDPGDIGYSLSARHDYGDTTLAGRVGWQAPMMQLEAQVELAKGRPALRTNARGTLLVAGGRVYARNRTATGFALVQAGTVEGIPVVLENRFVGKTDAKGRLLVEGISAQHAVRINVDDKQIPPDALVRGTEQVIRVPFRAVARVDIDAIRFDPVMRNVVDAGGAPLAAGLPVRAEPSGETTLTGYDGMVEINAGANDARIVIGPAGRQCVVDLAGIQLASGANEGPLRCLPAPSIAEGYAQGPADPKQARKRGRDRRKPAIALRGD